MTNKIEHRCGAVAIIGRPNVGKSTLLNHLLGTKLSIATRKPQTTRHQLLGIKTNKDSQILFVDTPGLQKQPQHAINRYMNRAALSTLNDVNLILMVIEASKWHEHDELAIKAVRDKGLPTLLIMNKVDKVKEKPQLLNFIEEMNSRYKFQGIVPLSARSEADVQSLEKDIVQLLPIAPAEFPDDQLSNRNERFFAAEFIREKLTRKLGDELPYQLAVTIDEFKEEGKTLRISATIWVERQGQKKILIGKEGSVLKAVGMEARKDMQHLFGQKVFLSTWVKVKKNWTDDDRALKEFDYFL